MDDSGTLGLLFITGLFLSAAVVVTSLWNIRSARTVGSVRHQVIHRSTRFLVLLGLLLVGLLVAFSDTDLPVMPSIYVLASAAALLGLNPSADDSVFGERGVRSGWYARRFEDLEEWRLTGEHLRWKLFGEWVSTVVPVERHAALRERLDTAAPGRESRFGS